MMDNKEKEKQPLLLRIILGIFGAGVYVYAFVFFVFTRIKEIFGELIKKLKPSKKPQGASAIDLEEYTQIVREEAYKVWPKQEMVDILEKYGTTFGNVQLPESITKEELCKLKLMGTEMYKRAIKSNEIVKERIRNNEFDGDFLFNSEYINNPETRRQALLLDVIAETLDSLKSESFGEELTEGEIENITAEDVCGYLNEIVPAFLDLGVMHFPAFASLSAYGQSIAKFEEMKKQEE